MRAASEVVGASCHAVVAGGFVVTVRLRRRGHTVEATFNTLSGAGSSRVERVSGVSASRQRAPHLQDGHTLTEVGRVRWSVGVPVEVLALTSVEEDATAAVLPVALVLSRSAESSTRWVLEVSLAAITRYLSFTHLHQTTLRCRIQCTLTSSHLKCTTSTQTHLHSTDMLTSECMDAILPCECHVIAGRRYHA